MKPRNESRSAPPVELGARPNPAEWLQWLAAKLAELRTPRTLPPLRTPRRPRLRTRRRSALAACCEARLAARADIPLEEYLQHRLSRQLGSLPVPPSRLPISIAVEPDGTLTVRPAEPAPSRR
ncbi:MAG TPA: hypothetical protein VE997_07355, partial [Candidatus Limnocylindria bacterium]|nr:hypothetical protein [Candidatus Limnocylindria bacterium]